MGSEAVRAGRVTGGATRTVSLIVNPAAGGGRAGRLLDDVSSALRANGLEHHVERTSSLEHARDLAQAAAAAGEVAVAFGGDGLIGAVAGGLRGIANETTLLRDNLPTVFKGEHVRQPVGW